MAIRRTRFQKTFRKALSSLLFAGFIGLSLSISGIYAQEIEQDPVLAPKQDSFKPISQSLRGQVENSGDAPFVLKGSIQTLESAIQEERDTVDWYGWYMATRQYIARRGGIACAPGTLLKFYRDGHVEADTVDTKCLYSILGMYAPLPKNTRLSAVILPSRSGQAPPASPSEIFERTKGFQ